MIAQSMSLSEAAHTLHAHFGRRFPASRAGGERLFAAMLREQFDLSEQDALQVVTKLARRQAIQWMAQPGLSRPCPSLLDLCGDWIIQPDRLA
jgi:hypothetical protein